MVLIRFTILGGDLRSVYLVYRLLRDGHEVCSFGLELSDIPSRCKYNDLEAALTNTNCVILPIPTADGSLLRAPYSCAPIPLDAVARGLPMGIPVFGSKCPLPVTDLTAIETMAIGNAALTAQGALLLILQHSPRSLMEQHVLILGAGRIGTLLGLQLKALGARVTITSRSSDRRALCTAMGMDTAHTYDLDHILPTADMVVNTVPSPVLDTAALSLLPAKTLLLELASLPGGFDPARAETLGLVAVMGRGLPGKYTPAGAADLIAKTIYHELELCV